MFINQIHIKLPDYPLIQYECEELPTTNVMVLFHIEDILFSTADLINCNLIYLCLN